MAAAMTKSAKRIVKTALLFGQKGLEPYSHPSSPQLYSQAQLFAILVLRQFLKMDLRSVTFLLKESTELREALGLKRVPHYSTLCYAEKRLSKKTSSMPSNLCF